MSITISPRLVAFATFAFALSTRAQTAPAAFAASDAAPPVNINDVVHPTKHPNNTLVGPYQFRQFYHLQNIDNLGEGQTIALIGDHHNPLIEHDLVIFSQRFGLPVCTLKTGCLQQIASARASAEPSPVPGTKTPDYNEESIDVEWAHAFAPAAHIMLVEAPSEGWPDLLLAVDAAVAHGATVVSLSLAEPERADHKQIYLDGDTHFLDTRASYVASAGDHGHTARWPASSPYVLGVGGTDITTNGYGGRIREVAWSKCGNAPRPSATGGGLSLAETEPLIQLYYGIPGDDDHLRGTPDVSMYATSLTGAAVYNSNVDPESGEPKLWHYGGGTSVGAPMWAGLLARANSMRAAKGKSSLAQYAGAGLQGTLAAIYAVARSTSNAFFDITEGSNGDCGAECHAGLGYDYLTGLGSPNGEVLLNALTALP
jgi:subtilase family serine protease